MPRIAEMEISTMQADCFPITITRQREDLGRRGWGVGVTVNSLFRKT